MTKKRRCLLFIERNSASLDREEKPKKNKTQHNKIFAMSKQTQSEREMKDERKTFQTVFEQKDAKDQKEAN